MAFKFRPVDGTFFESLTELAQHLEIGADLLAQVLADEADRAAIAGACPRPRHDADEITHSIVRQVNQTFVTPIDREDIYALATGLDDVMDRMDEAADLILLYEVEPAAQGVRQAGRAPPALRRAHRRRRCRGWARGRISPTTGPRSTAWRAPATSSTGASWPSCSTVATKPLEVIKLKDIISAMEAAIDGFERVANTVEQIVVKES